MSLEAACARRSVRGFLTLPQETLDKVFDLARWFHLAPIFNHGKSTWPRVPREILTRAFMQRTKDKHPPSVDHKDSRILLARSGRPAAGMCGRVVRRDGCGLGR